VLLLSAACDPEAPGAGEPGESGEAGDSGDSGEGEPIAVAIDCSMYYAETTETLTVDEDEEAFERTYGQVHVEGRYFDDEFEGRSFQLGFHTDDGVLGVNGLFQMPRDRIVANQFHGDHGFTGLQSVRDPGTEEGIQYACFARDKSAPVHMWED
jgi:hypothetical protein